MSNATTFTTAQLANRQEMPLLPFSVQIGGEGNNVWLCQDVFRILPNRRIVLKLHQGSTTVVAKIFYRQKDFDREVRGERRLRNRGIASPKIIRAKKIANENTWYIHYQYITSPSLDSALDNARNNDKATMLVECCELIAKMHSTGVYQNDIHFDNFLYEHKKLWVIDTASVKRQQPRISKRRALQNLGLLLAQLHYDDVPDLNIVCSCYNNIYDISITPTALRKAINNMTAKRWHHYKKKLTRNCSEFAVSKSKKKFSVVRKNYLSDELKEKLANIDRWLESGQYLKQGNTATVAKVEYSGQAFVIKRYNIKSWRHALTRALRRTRGWSSWHNGNYLRFAGIKTPLPIALIEERIGPFSQRAWLLTEYTDGIDLLASADESSISPITKTQLPVLAASLIQQLVNAHVSHGDMKATNIMVTCKGLELIDLDSMIIHSNTKTLQQHIKQDISRFLRNWPNSNLKQDYTEALQNILDNSLLTP